MEQHQFGLREWADLCERKDATIAALQEKLTAALKVKADYDRWLSGGVYFTTAEYEKHAEEHRQREAALQARVKELTAEIERLKKCCSMK